MLVRSLLMLAALLLLTAVLASLVAPRDGADRRTTTPLAPAAPEVAPAPAAGPGAEITWKLPGARVVHAHVGDVITLTVSAAAGDVADLPQLGLDAPVDEGVPATLTFVADRPGRFEVVLRYAHRTLGILDVEPAAS